MKKRLILIVLFGLFSLMGISQAYTEVLKSLNLPVYKFNQKPASNEKVVKSKIHPDISNSETKLPTDKIFNKVTLYYDELNELNIVIYDIISQPILQSNKKKLLNSIKKISSSEKNVNEESGIFHVFVSEGTEITLFEPNEKYRVLKPYLKVKPVNNVKVIEKNDESGKIALYPINFETWVSDEDSKYEISFVGYKEGKKILIRILSLSNNLKQFESIQIKTDNGEIYSATLTTSQRVVDREALGQVKQETGVAEIPKEWIKKILASKSTRIKIEGKKPGEVFLTNEIMYALKAVNEKLR